MPDTANFLPSTLIPAVKMSISCSRVACHHRLLSIGEAEDLERYLLSRMPILAEKIPTELLQDQLVTGHLLPTHVVNLLVRRLRAARTPAAAVMLHRILRQNLELAREHDECDLEDHGPRPRGEALPPKWPSLWCSSDLQQCLSDVQEACSAGGAPPVGPHLFLQYVLECMSREWDLQRKTLWIPCSEAMAELLSQVLLLAVQGVPLYAGAAIGCPPLGELLMEILCMYDQVSSRADSSVCALLFAAVEQLSSFVALRAFFRTLHHRDLRMQLADMVLSSKFSLATAAGDNASTGPYSQPSLQRTLTEHFTRVPDPEAVGMWSSCACLLMLLCYLVQCHLEAPGLNPAHSRQAIQTAIHKLTEQLSEDTRLFSQLTSPDCWFYLQYLTCLA